MIEFHRTTLWLVTMPLSHMAASLNDYVIFF